MQIKKASGTSSQDNIITESIPIGIILAIGGGFMDAYSYSGRDGVFANAQTGNMLLLGISIAGGKWGRALRYLIPVFLFAIGIVLSDLTKNHFYRAGILNWRQIALLFEIAALFIVSFMPQKMNLAANSITSLACGIQVESFRRIEGNSVATTMCIGNLRSGMNHLITFAEEKNMTELKKSILYFGIIIFL